MKEPQTLVGGEYRPLCYVRPSALKLMVLAFLASPLAFLLFNLSGGPALFGGAGQGLASGLLFLALGAILVPAAHELIHGLTANALGYRTSYGVGPGYAYTTLGDAIAPRNDFVLIAVAPLAVVAALGGLGAIAFPAVAPWVALVVALNVTGSVGDIWTCGVLLRYPARVLVADRRDGFQVFG